MLSQVGFRGVVRQGDGAATGADALPAPLANFDGQLAPGSTSKERSSEGFVCGNAVCLNRMTIGVEFGARLELQVLATRPAGVLP